MSKATPETEARLRGEGAAYDRGVRDTLERLTRPEAVRAACISDAERYASAADVPSMPDDEAVEVYGEANRALLASVAAALSGDARERTERA